MKFGKVESLIELENLDLSLPLEPHENEAYPSSIDRNAQIKVFIGAPAWGVKDWKGKIYPEKLKSEEYLNYYAKSFNSIELNTTHYRLPEQSDIYNWLKQVPSDFLFCPKVTQSISHFSGLTNKLKVEEYFNRMNSFGTNLGLHFLQLHENFSPKRFADLSKFINYIPKGTKLAIELRHPDWFRDQGIFNYLRSKGIGTVISDTAGRGDVLHMNITAPFTVIRFVGNNLHQTDYQRIDDWVEKIKQWNDKGLEEIFFFVHEPQELACPEISDYFIQTLNKNELTTSASIKFVQQQDLSLF